ncbi:hypothetical protein ACLOJK_030276 [Asimina triloba]
MLKSLKGFDMESVAMQNDMLSLPLKYIIDLRKHLCNCSRKKPLMMMICSSSSSGRRRRSWMESEGEKRMCWVKCQNGKRNPEARSRIEKDHGVDFANPNQIQPDRGATLSG